VIAVVIERDRREPVGHAERLYDALRRADDVVVAVSDEHPSVEWDVPAEPVHHLLGRGVEIARGFDVDTHVVRKARLVRQMVPRTNRVDQH
jgi:hypothetical protein